MNLRSCAALTLAAAGVLAADTAGAGSACGASDPTFVLASPTTAARVPGGQVLPHEIYVACPEPSVLLPFAAAAEAGAGISALAPDHGDGDGERVLVAFDRQIGAFRPADVLQCSVATHATGNQCTRVFSASARGIPAGVRITALDALGTQLALSFDREFNLGAQRIRTGGIYVFNRTELNAPLLLNPTNSLGLDAATGIGDYSLLWDNRVGLARDRWSISTGGGPPIGPGQVGLQIAESTQVTRVFDLANIDPSWRAAGIGGLGSRNHARASFEVGSISVAENGGVFSLNVRRPTPAGSSPGVAQGTIRYSVVLVNGTAVAGTDFAFQPPQLVQFDNADVTPKTVSFSLINNAIADGNRSFTVRMAPISAFAAPGQFMEVQVTIVDDEGGGDAIFANGFE